jgi:hypothetical protein
LPSTSEILSRIDDVLADNKRTEVLFLVLTVLLFLAGISCFVIAVGTGQFAWSLPGAGSTAFLRWPIREIKDIRAKNIALATAPLLITQLPPEQAAIEVQKLLQALYDGGASR